MKLCIHINTKPNDRTKFGPSTYIHGVAVCSYLEKLDLKLLLQRQLGFTDESNHQRQRHVEDFPVWRVFNHVGYLGDKHHTFGFIFHLDSSSKFTVIKLKEHWSKKRT